jgi:hypothetical protein
MTVLQLAKKFSVTDPENSFLWYKILPLVSDLRRLNPVCTLTLYDFKVRSNIIFPSTSISRKWSLCFRIFQEFLKTFMRAECSIHLILFDLLALIFSEEFTLRKIPVCNFFHISLLHSVPKYYWNWYRRAWSATSPSAVWSILPNWLLQDSAFSWWSRWNLHLPFNEKLLNNLRPTEAENIIIEHYIISKKYSH